MFQRFDSDGSEYISEDEWIRFFLPLTECVEGKLEGEKKVVDQKKDVEERP